MSAPSARRPGDVRLAAYVAAGVAVGALYVVFDLLSESRLAHGTLTGALAGAHFAIDHTLPLVAGALLGVSAHSLRLRAELALARAAEERAEALRERLHKVERDQAVWVLAAAVLHELKNPLHALGLLLDEIAARQGDGPARELTERGHAQVARALAQLDVLRSMRSEGEPDFERVPLDRVVRAIAADMSALAEEDGLAVRVEGDIDVVASGDPSYIRTIVENLVDNGLHALRARGRGAVTIEVGRSDGRARVVVRDDGPPFAPGVEGALFEPLRTTRSDGMGLGLPIARALARAMRGDLLLADAASKSFRLELPLAGPP